MDYWTYETKPLPGFIKLPDGTIINVAHIASVFQEKKRPGDVYIETVNESGSRHADPHGKIYEYFNGIAQEVK